MGRTKRKNRKTAWSVAVPEKGIYCLVIHLDKEAELKVGKLGKFLFPKGFYCYIGSAMNNLEARLKRHLSKKKTKNWHIDYLLEKAGVLYLKAIGTERRIECKLSRAIEKIADKQLVRKFGSMDCKCFSHLHYFEMNPLFRKEFHAVFEET